MTQPSTTLVSLITRGLAAAAAMLQLEYICKRKPAMNQDDEVRVAYAAHKAQFQTYATVLRGYTMNATAADMELALRFASQHPSSEGLAWTALIEKLSASEYAVDREMADTLRQFA